MTRTPTFITGGAIALAAGAVAIAGMSWLQSSPPAAAPAAVPAATAEIIRGDLRDTKAVTGTLGYGELTALRPRLAEASAMVTWLASVGSTVARGAPLYRLDGQPTVLFYGSVPQHRTLRFDRDNPSPIWVELEQAQTAVEAAELTLLLEQERLADAEARATDADARLADALSSTPAMPEFIQIAGAVHAAEAKLARVRELAAAELAPMVEIAAAEAELAAAGATFDAAIRVHRKDLSAAGLDAVTARVAVAGATVKRDELRSALEALASRTSDDADIAQLAENLKALGHDEGTLAVAVRAWQKAAGLPVTGIVGPGQVVIADGPAHIAAHTASVGETLTASSPDRGSILDYSGTQKLVVVQLAVADQALAAVGRAVTVTLPNDTEIDGT
ncbi:MAG: peptidoglycan-binding domain-containing protein, partial [Devosia sp.]